MPSRFFWALALSLLCKGLLPAQAQFQVSGIGGRLIKINAVFPDLPAPAWAVDLCWEQGRVPTRAFAAPHLGIGLRAQSLGNAEVLGRAYAAYGRAAWPLATREGAGLWAETGLGLAWLSRHYDAFDNPSNNVIGSALNGFALLRLAGRWPLAGPWRARAGLELAHYSNARVRAPNVGANAWGIELGLAYAWGNAAALPPLAPPPALPRRRWGLGLHYGMGYYAFAPGGPLERLSAYGLALHYRWPSWQAWLGAEYLHDAGRARFLQHIGAATGQGEARPERHKVALGAEALLGRRWGLYAELGAYTQRHYLMHSWLATRFGLRAWPLGHGPYRPFASLGLRAYGGEAECVEWGLGLLF